MRLLSTILVSAALAGCVDLTQTNPNQRSTDIFWKSSADAVNGINAAYNGLTLDGTYGRNLVMLFDGRSDIAHGLGANGNINALIRFSFLNYDAAGYNSGVWDDHYHTIYRANQVIENVPAIEMDEGMRSRIVAEAKFIRALMYFNLVTLYENIPLVLEPLEHEDRPTQSTPDLVWAQIEKDLQEARQVLPRQYPAADLGRATWGAATSLLGKAHLQQGEWAPATQLFKEVIDANRYSLLPNFADLFDDKDENHAESIFEVQFADLSLASSGARGNDVPRLYGAAGVAFIQLQPTPWYHCQFYPDPDLCMSGDRTGTPDPRIDATMFWNRPGGMDVFGRPYLSRYPRPTPRNIYWKKYSEHWKTAQDWDAPVNFTVIRYADVLLMHAEALTELGRVAEAVPFVDRVRRRAGVAPIPAGIGQPQLEKRIEREYLLELGWEHARWLYLRRQNLLPRNAQELQAFVARDAEFSTFVPGKSERMPIPLIEVNFNPNVKQNPGY